ISAFEEVVQQRATSLYEETNKVWDRRLLIQQLLKKFEASFETYLGEGFANVKQKWESYGFRINEKVKIKTVNDSFESTFLGIAEDGALLVSNETGEPEKLYSGEIEWFR